MTEFTGASVISARDRLICHARTLRDSASCGILAEIDYGLYFPRKRRRKDKNNGYFIPEYERARRADESVAGDS